MIVQSLQDHHNLTIQFRDSNNEHDEQHINMQASLKSHLEEYLYYHTYFEYSKTSTWSLLKLMLNLTLSKYWAYMDTRLAISDFSLYFLNVGNKAKEQLVPF